MPAMINSTQDDAMLSIEAERRFKDLCEAYLRITGQMLDIPASLNSDMLRWRTMAVRHRSGDFRHTDGELKSLRTLCQWMVDTNCTMRNQPTTKIQWEPSSTP